MGFTAKKATVCMCDKSCVRCDRNSVGVLPVPLPIEKKVVVVVFMYSV